MCLIYILIIFIPIPLLHWHLPILATPFMHSVIYVKIYQVKLVYPDVGQYIFTH